ncbi:MAG: hypothetical protein M1821_010023 [Bathelium mastoideum]|nr:MAG: hypothetical protein M1821_010023 [Bathelium mastoideum]
MTTRTHRGGSGSKPFNTLSFGYGGQSVMAPKQEWWTEERIESTVTKDYVLTKLPLEERERLFHPISFGGLTDDTYLDWILTKARRFFLILDTIGLPGQIFRVLNASWDDDDLPLSKDDVRGLKLAEKNDEKLNSRFFTFQHSYCLKETKRGSHTKYNDSELIPVEFVSKAPAAAPISGWECCRLVASKRTFVRRRFSLGNNSYQPSEEEFVDNVNRARDFKHEHIANIWASYTWRGSGYVMSAFVAEHTLKSFMEQKAPPYFQKLSKSERAIRLQEWIMCLSHAVKTLHDRGWTHTEIRPSNILVDASNNIAFSDIGSLSMFQTDKKRDDQEVYNYSPPENFGSSTSKPAVSHHRESKVSTTSSSGASSYSTRSGSSADFLKGFGQKAHAPPSPPLSEIGEGSEAGSPVDQMLRSPEKADIFSLGCIFLEILTYLMAGKLSGFVKQRTSKRKNSISLPSSNVTSAPALKSNSSKTDTSFHANLGKIESWIKHLSDESCEYDESCYRGVPRLLKVVRSMVSQNPQLRPSAQQVCEKVCEALKMHSGIASTHCFVVPNSEESEEDRRRRSEAESLTTLQHLNATNLFRLRNAANSTMNLRKRESISIPAGRDVVSMAIPPSPPRTESPVSPVGSDVVGMPREHSSFVFPPTYQTSPITAPPTSSPSKSVPQRPPRGVSQNAYAPAIAPRSEVHPELRRAPSYASESSPFSSYSPIGSNQEPIPRSISPVSAMSTDPLGIIQEYARKDYVMSQFTPPATRAPSNPTSSVEPARRSSVRSAGSTGNPMAATIMQRAPSNTSSTSSTRTAPPRPPRPADPTVNLPPLPTSSFSPALTRTLSAPSYSFLPAQQYSKSAPYPAPTDTLPPVPPIPTQALPPLPLGALPEMPYIPPRTSSTRLPPTIPALPPPPPTTMLPPVPPPTTALPQIPHHRHQPPPPLSLPIHNSRPIYYPHPAPPFHQTKSAPEAIPHANIAAPELPPDIPPKSPRRVRGHSRTSTNTSLGAHSDVLLDDALSAWTGTALAPQQGAAMMNGEHQQRQLPYRRQHRPQSSVEIGERVDFDLGTLSGVALGAEGWRDYLLA